jgi:uncharacterized membrane protein YeaQ/YmgE (transglycosylase-associated protein family)
MWSILWSIIIGGLAGALAKLIMPGKDPGGIIVTILLGIVGSVIFTLIAKQLNFMEGDDLVSFWPALLGSIVLLFIYRLIKGKGAAKAVKD